jgi:uncharacterized protein
MTAEDVIRALQLQPHPVEGGFFRETWRSDTTVSLPGYPGPRSVGTAIYYLIKPGHVSELHVLPGDEVFHFYRGSPVQMLQLWPDGSHRTVVLGSDVHAGQMPQCVVPNGVWQGTRLLGQDGFALLGATMAPGFDYADYVGASREELIAKWPKAAEEIVRLTPRG